MVVRFEELIVTPTSADERRMHLALGELLRDHAAVRDRAALLVTELLSDADRSTGDERLTIRVFADADVLRVEVHDAGRGAVLRRIRQSPGAGGHGWNPHLMNRIADRWGLVSEEEGAWVWFELAMSGELR